MLFMSDSYMDATAAATAGLISFKMSRQFSLKNKFVVSPNSLLPLKRFPKCMDTLQTMTVRKAKMCVARSHQTYLAVSKLSFDFSISK